MSQSLILPQYPADFSLSGHTHSQYLTSHQSLTNYATKTYVDNAVAGIDTSTVPTHSHSGYASSSHTHSSYASSSHTHSYASTSHTHSGYASSSHTHSASDITGLNTGSGGGGSSIISKGEITSGEQTFTLTKAASYILVIIQKSTYGTRAVHVLTPGENAGIEASLSNNGKTVTIAVVDNASTSVKFYAFG